MADTKITQLQPPQVGYPVVPATDVLPIVVIADPGMATSGSTRKVTVNQLLGAGGTATLASATITGALTVNGQTALNTDLTVTTLGLSTLKVTAAKVGIGTSSPTETLHVAKTTATGAFMRLQDSANSNYFGTDNGNLRITNAGASDLINISQLGVFTFGDGAGGTRMTLNATGLGVGVVSPATKLDVLGNAALTGTSGFKYLYFNLATDINSVRGAKIGKNYDSPFDLNIHATTSATGLGNEAAIKFFRNNTDVSMTLDSSGNVGIGVTPSAWASGFKYIQAGPGSSFGSTGTVDRTDVSANWFFDTTNRYINATGKATRFTQNAGSFSWLQTSVDSGGAGSIMTLIQAMTLDTSGRLLVGTTALNASWDTRLTLSSDSGTTRWAVGPYAAPQNFVISSGAATGVYLNGTAATSWTSASDERLKDIIEPISNAVSKVASLRAVIGKFKFDENNTRKPFLIAQDIQAVLPEAVDASNPDQLGVSYTDVIPLLVAAIKELTARVQTLEAK